MDSLYLYVNNFNMEAKLTLRLNKRVIDLAKNYAHLHEVSLSKMIESLLDSVTAEKSAD